MCRPDDFPPYPTEVICEDDDCPFRGRPHAHPLEEELAPQPPQVGAFRSEPYDPALCPRCLGLLPTGYPGALSRADNETEVCSTCGFIEAIRDLGHLPREVPGRDWPVTLGPSSARSFRMATRHSGRSEV